MASKGYEVQPCYNRNKLVYHSSTTTHCENTFSRLGCSKILTDLVTDFDCSASRYKKTEEAHFPGINKIVILNNLDFSEKHARFYRFLYQRYVL